MHVQEQGAALAPGEHRFLVDGGELCYHVAGQGPVCLVHPGGAGAEWRYLRMPKVERHATLVYIEPIGTGRSGRLPRLADYSIERDAAHIDALRGHLALERVGLLGHSYGGMVALTYALGHPDGLSELILYSTAPTTGPEFDAEVQANLLWFKDRPWFAEASGALRLFFRARTDDEKTAGFRKIMPLFFADYDGRRAEFEALGRNARAFAVRDADAMPPPFEVRARLSEIRTPTLILAGDRDFICPVKWARTMEQGIAGARLVVFARTGHMAHIEEPAAFADAIADFFADRDRRA
jgi:proline iminopeptidase